MTSVKSETSRNERQPFSLELAQRDFHGLLDEDMMFNEGSLAEAIRLTVTECGMDVGHRNFLLALADSLDQPAAEWKLTLSRRKRGKFKSPADSNREFLRDYWIAQWVDKGKREGIKVEATVAMLCEANGWSRASVFASLKRKRRLDKLSDELGLRKARLKSPGAESSEKQE